MNTRDYRRLPLLIMLVVFSLPGMAATDNAFQTGAESFNQGYYAAAVKAFKEAESQGMKSPALYYNLASSYYKLGEYDKARQYFEKVRRYSGMKYLAEYNLGLVALKQDDTATAEKWFSGVAKNSKDKKLVVLAETRLKETGKKKSAKKEPPPWLVEKWTAYLSASLGYDSNVNFAPLGIANERSDSFSEIFASADYLFSGNRRTGWLGEAYFYDINYLNENIFDEFEYGANIKRLQQLSRNWQARFSADLKKSNYGGEDYQTITTLGAQGRNTLAKDQYLFLRYAYEDIRSDNTLFDYLEGWRQRMRAEYRIFRKNDNGRLYYELELNDRNDLIIANGGTADGLYSYSPTRHVFRGRYTYIFNPEWRMTGDLSYRASAYPTTPNQDRQDDRIRATAYADYRITPDIRLRGKVEYTDNRSTESVFAYKRTVYTLGLNALF